MFTDPELARVGLNEMEAKARGIAYRLAKMPMAGVLRAVAFGETRGFVKMLIDAESDRILGFTAFGAEASEMIAAVQTAMLGGLPYTVLRDAIFTHPTVAEGLVFLLANVPARAMRDGSSSVASASISRHRCRTHISVQCASRQYSGGDHPGITVWWSESKCIRSSTSASGVGNHAK